ncbi:MAG: hypothetical protein J6X18_06880 [Bacteroidales bacterium]|nr:hypothetical protein [Bacteroidales bacterium]
MRKSIILTTEQIRRFKGRVLREAFAVNTTLVNDIRAFIDKKFSYTTYDDVNEDGDIVQKVAIQMLSSNGEPLQTISPEKMLDKMDSKFAGKIKDDRERREFIRQILIDWVDGKITKDGLLSVNSTGK